jgi:hypothetical protein
LRILPLGGGEAGEAQDPEAADLGARLDAIHAEVRSLDERRAGLDEERALLERYEKVLVALAPLLGELEGARQIEALGIVLRRKEKEALALLEEELARITGGAYTLLLRDIDEEHTGGLLAVSRQIAPAVGQLLFEKGVAEVKLPERYAGRSFAEGVRLLVKRRAEIEGEIASCERGTRGARPSLAPAAHRDAGRGATPVGAPARHHLLRRHAPRLHGRRLDAGEAAARAVVRAGARIRRAGVALQRAAGA